MEHRSLNDLDLHSKDELLDNHVSVVKWLATWPLLGHCWILSFIPGKTLQGKNGWQIKDHMSIYSFLRLMPELNSLFRSYTTTSWFLVPG